MSYQGTRERMIEMNAVQTEAVAAFTWGREMKPNPELIYGEQPISRLRGF